MAEPADSPEIASPPVLAPARVRLVKLPGGVPDLDADLRLRAGLRPAGDTIKIRVPLQMYAVETQNYPGLRNNSWVLEFAQAEDVSAFRDYLGEAIKHWVEGQQ